MGTNIWFSFGFAMFHRGFDYIGYDGYAATHTGYLLHGVREPFPVKIITKYSKKTFAFYGGMVYTCEDVRIRVCGCKSRPVAGETIHISGPKRP